MACVLMNEKREIYIYIYYGHEMMVCMFRDTSHIALSLK